MIEPEIQNKIIELRKLDVSIRDISDIVDIPKSTVHDFLTSRVTNVLIIGDLHLPWALCGYREFCFNTYKKYDCNKIIFIGDLIDNHFSSYHETNPDGYGAGDELSYAKKELGEWYKIFPMADVVLGNHDKLVIRKAKTSGISKHWIKSFSDVLGVPNWNFKEEFYYDNVLYRHGVNAIGATNVLSDGCSIVQGHAHSECRLRWKCGKGDKVFGLQCPCGVDDSAYAFEYNDSRKSIIGCAVVLDNGKLPIIELMEL